MKRGVRAVWMAVTAILALTSAAGAGHAVRSAGTGGGCVNGIAVIRGDEMVRLDDVTGRYVPMGTPVRAGQRARVRDRPGVCSTASPGRASWPSTRPGTCGHSGRRRTGRRAPTPARSRARAGISGAAAICSSCRSIRTPRRTCTWFAGCRSPSRVNSATSTRAAASCTASPPDRPPWSAIDPGTGHVTVLARPVRAPDQRLLRLGSGPRRHPDGDLEHHRHRVLAASRPPRSHHRAPARRYRPVHAHADAAGCPQAWDYGDAPAGYRTTLAADGPRHLISTFGTLTIGTRVHRRSGRAAGLRGRR